jgi:catechol 2,3-dioxygenase-like lactoylglutathione lyase family enzyme
MGMCLYGQLSAADLAAPNERGVSMGHLHFHVHDVAANQKFWTDLGGTASQFDGQSIISFPDISIILSPGDYSGTSDGSVVNHMAFRVDSLARLVDAGIGIEFLPGVTGIATLHTPEGERIELFDEQATNLFFIVDDDAIDSSAKGVADRHNQPIQVPITSHHLHFYVPGEEFAAARNWYVDYFGGVPGKRWEYDAADLPGINLNFSAAKAPVSPTHGRMVDHIGFEVEDLDSFSQVLIDKGLVLDTPVTILPSGMKSVFLADPWGTRIELTEGLGRLSGGN